MTTASPLVALLARAPAILHRIGEQVSRYGLVVVLAWIGFGKLEKFGARELIQTSPLMSWIFDFISPPAFGRVLGTAEMTAALLIALRFRWPALSAGGSAIAIGLFSGTLSFLFTAPGVVATHFLGLPVLAERPGQFLLKDLVLIGVSIWTLGESLLAAQLHVRDDGAQGGTALSVSR